MTELAILLPLVGFVALAALTAIVLRRAGRIVARTREVDVFRTTIADLATRIGSSLDGAAAQIDAVRRGQAGAETVEQTVSAASDAVERYLAETRALGGPPAAIEIRDDIAAELERAGRALDMVDHGASILTRVRRRGRELEAQTAIKRGYLNLIHAREAIERHAARAQELDASSATAATEEVIGVRESRS